MNNIIVKQQSGFRAHRQIKDNIFNLCQKNLEAFNRKMKNCVIFFDITKAFDKIWHNGLLYKLIKNKFDKYIIKWIAEFLDKRSFKIKVNSSFSNNFNIEVGVPQGGVLSPILFSIFINYIIFDKTQYRKTKTDSTLFADDCCSKNISVINQQLKCSSKNSKNGYLNQDYR
jgi:retron-type reverse transcriptase